LQTFVLKMRMRIPNEKDRSHLPANGPGIPASE
jgi:hypothetical protein